MSSGYIFIAPQSPFYQSGAHIYDSHGVCIPSWNSGHPADSDGRSSFGDLAFSPSRTVSMFAIMTDWLADTCATLTEFRASVTVVATGSSWMILIRS